MTLEIDVSSWNALKEIAGSINCEYTDGDSITIRKSGKQKIHKIARQKIKKMIKQGLIIVHQTNRLKVTATGFVTLKSHNKSLKDYRAQHLDDTVKPIFKKNNLKANNCVVTDVVKMLASRKGRDGKALLLSHHVEASTRLYKDYYLANLSPSLGVNWSNFFLGNRSQSNTFLEPKQAMLDGKKRLSSALGYVGDELSIVLLDVCCLERGLSEVEKKNNWPERSGKVVLRIALDRLAKYYGLSFKTRSFK